jgi:hypothetical protein
MTEMLEGVVFDLLCGACLDGSGDEVPICTMRDDGGETSVVLFDGP